MMRLLRSRWTIALLFVLVVGGGAFAATKRRTTTEDVALTAKVTRGKFKVTVTVAGDLRAKNSVLIAPPQNTCMVGACQLKIASIIPEGSLVHKGDTVIELDRSPIVTYTNNTNLSMQKANAVFEQAQLDTTLNLSKAREDLRIATTALEERRIAKEQATYEAPSIRRQADIDYDKAERALKQQQADYTTRENQAKAKMREVSTDLQRNQNSLNMVKEVVAQFTVTAPADGMLIYSRDYSGKKRMAGSQLYYGEASLAELPDLRHMMSTTYVNEVDIRKVSVGQSVVLTLDSDPSKHLTGKVTQVANVGEERPNSDAKVFEVKIEVAESDTTLRPGMTTSNAIEVLKVDSALSVPLEALTTEGETPFVFKKSGSTVVKQEVETVAINDTHVQIARGVTEGETVLLVPPPNHTTMVAVRLPGDGKKVPATLDDKPAGRTLDARTRQGGTPTKVPPSATPGRPNGKP